jgi:electron transfer flavoprotein alpha subunit
MSQDIYVLAEHVRDKVEDITFIMLAAGRKLTEAIGGELVAILLGCEATDLTSEFECDRVLCFDDPAFTDFNSDVYVQAIANLVREEPPRAILFGDTTIGAGVAGRLSAQLGHPLISSCYSFQVVDDDIRYVSRICGGRIVAEGSVPDPVVLLTMIPGAYKVEEGKSDAPKAIETRSPGELSESRITLRSYIEPELDEVDISQERVLVAIGRGIQREDNIELAEELAQALGGVVCSSRPVVDQGWLPSSRMVGKSGMRVKPELYLALGISGAPEHLEGIANSGTIVAINTDPSAPIFEIAQYGAEVDIHDFIPALTQRVKEVTIG